MADNSLVLSRAKAAALSRDFALATRLYKQLLAAKPDDQDILGELGNLYIKSGEDSRALPLFRKLIQQDPKNIENLITLGGIYRRLKQYGNSVAVLEQALALGSNNPQVSYNLGFTFKVMGNYDDAIACFEEVIDANPSDVLAYNHVGSIYAAQKNHQQAIETYRRALKIDPNHPVLQLNMAKSYEALEEYDKATRSYELALRSKPGWLEAIDSYTNLLLKQDKVREAYDVVRSALNLNPQDVKMHTKMGDVFARQSVYSNAAKEYQSALERDENYEPALLGLSDSQENLGYSLDAAKNIEKVADRHPEDEEIQKRATGVLLSAGDFAGAFKKIDKLWEKNPRDLETINLLAQYYICMNKIAKAEKCFSRIKSLNIGYANHFRDAAKRFRQKGDLLNAEKYYRAAIDKNPRDPKALVSLASLLEEESQGDAALELYKKASRLDHFNVASKNGVKRLQEGFDEDGFGSDFGDDDRMGLDSGVVRSLASDEPTENLLEEDLNADFEIGSDEIALDDFDDSDFAPASEMEIDDDDLLEKEEVEEEEPVPGMEEAAKEEFDDPMAFTDSDDPLVNEKDDLIDLLDQGEETGLEDKNVVGEKPEKDDLIDLDDDLPGGSAFTGGDLIDAGGAADEIDEIDLGDDLQFEEENSGQETSAPSPAPTLVIDTGALSKSLEEMQEKLESATEAAEKAAYAAEQAWNSANEAADSAMAAEEARRQNLEEENAQWEAEMAAAEEEESEPAEDPEAEADESEPVEETTADDDEFEAVEERAVEDEDTPLAEEPEIEDEEIESADEPEPPEDPEAEAADSAEPADFSAPTTASQISLLKELRTLTGFLPQAKRDEFGSSSQSQRLDSLIDRLSAMED